MASKFKKFLGNALPVIGAATGNPFLAVGGGAMGGAINDGARGAITGGVTGGISNYAGNKLFGGGNNPLKMLGNLFSGGQQGSISNATVPGVKTNFLSPTNLKIQQSMISGSGLGMGGGFGGGNQSGQESSKGSAFKNPLLLGGLAAMLGSQFIRSPKVPELPQSVIDFQNQARSGNPLMNQASQALSQQLGQTQQDLSQDEINAINRQYDLAQEDELKSIDSMYKSLRPGTDPLTDTAYQKDLARVRDRYATLRADSVANAQRQISNDFASQRANQIAQAVGLSQQQLDQLAQLSQYDLERALAQFNINDRDREYLRNYLFETGGQFVQDSLFPQTGYGE